MGCQFNRLAGTVATRPCNDRDPFIDRFNGDINDPGVLFHVQSGGFSSGSTGNDSTRAILDLKFNQFAIGLLIYFTSFKGRNNRHNGSFKHNDLPA